METVLLTKVSTLVETVVLIIVVLVFQQTSTLLLKSQEVRHSWMLIFLLVVTKRRGHLLRVIILDLPMNQFIDHRSSTWSSSRGSFNFAKKHRSYDVSSNRYDGPCSLGEKYSNYLKNNPCSTLSPEEFERMSKADIGSFNRSDTQNERSIRCKVSMCGRM